MSNCTDCFNGCTDITSDRCVKYTGVDILVLGISNGDSLSFVEQALIEFLTSTLTGLGIKPDIDNSIICEVVQKYLPDCGDISIVDLITALIKSSCDLQEQITTINTTLSTLNSSYTISCLSGVDNSSDTHTIVQSIINKVCSIDSTLNDLILNISTNYVQLSDLNTFIAEYLTSISFGTAIKNKMVPYTAVEYYGPLTNFDGTGKGIGDWDRIYLCNGSNGTPDKRGRVPVGTTGMFGLPITDPIVNPSVIGNPSYSLYSIGGFNNVTLSGSQMPGHTHIASRTITELPHYHYEFSSDSVAGDSPYITNTTYPARADELNSSSSYRIMGAVTGSTLGKSSLTSTGLDITITNSSTGGNLAHPNIQPVLACYYIIYLP